MNTVDALLLAEEEVRQCLAKAKFRDGDMGDVSDAKARKGKDYFVSYRTRARIDAGSSPVIAVWRIEPPTGYGRADGHVAQRILRAYVDVVTTHRPGDPELNRALRNLESGFLKNGWSFEMAGSDTPDQASNRLIINFVAEKAVR